MCVHSYIHTHADTHKQTHYFNQVKLLGMLLLPLGVISYLTKLPVPGMGTFPMSCLKNFQNNIAHCHCPWVPPRTWRLIPLLKIPRTQNLKELSSNYLEASSLRTGPQSVKCYTDDNTTSKLQSLWATTTGMARHPQGYYVDTMTLGVTTSSLLGLKVHLIGGHSSLVM